MKQFTLGGRPVVVPPVAAVPPEYLPRGESGHLVQSILDGVEAWRGDTLVIETGELTENVPVNVVPLDGRTPSYWAVHSGHTARTPGLSPFVYTVGKKKEVTNLLTVELKGAVAKPVLIRVYPGEYEPPLPWMNSAADVADGGVAECEEFWRTHAYVLHRRSLMVRGTGTNTPPKWFR